ncbi:hypothetical protein GMOD_00000831 [Pyrenophora seminiperda CCB06]|uniref:Uncharacterized protein n=1 Tax=Pyrenophora seminiperda CCB06 TaxID=1302712 RepID=A0A3M7M8J5_9PLEO|nr:hypothetical protein GMOD_00000831 [Pyrenophora seminiperda CCB06]
MSQKSRRHSPLINSSPVRSSLFDWWDTTRYGVTSYGTPGGPSLHILKRRQENL